MNAERIAYVVTRGSYSDYGISAVFDNEAAATAYAATRGNCAQVETYTLNSTEPQQVDYVVVSINQEGVMQNAREETTDDWIATRSDYPCVGTLWVSAVGVDVDHALKAARDALAKYKAEEAGL